jgi:RNA polymerase sigma-70 factor, ECF subfamily
MPAAIGSDLVALLPRLRRYAITVCRDPHLADDFVQVACEKALTTEQGPGDGVPMDAWMFRILRNAWIDRVRAPATSEASLDLEEHDVSDAAYASRQMDAQLDMERVQWAIEQLPPERKEVIMLVCVEELSYKDASQVLGVPLGTVMSRLARARTQLAELTGWSQDAKIEDV